VSASGCGACCDASHAVAGTSLATESTLGVAHLSAYRIASGRKSIMAATETMEAYCVKCREKREIKDMKEVTLGNGRRAAQGVCPVCGTKLTRMLPNKK